MNPEKWKKFSYPKFDKYEKLDLNELTKLEIDYSKLTALANSFDIDSFNKNFNATTDVRSTMLDMDVIIGMTHDGEMEIIKNERGEEGFKYVNINVIMRMFIKALRTGIMRFNTNRFQLFSDSIERDLENAIMGVVRKYDLERKSEEVREYQPWRRK